MKEVAINTENTPETLEEALLVIVELKAHIGNLEKKISELVELLKLNSNNSSLSPSSDKRRVVGKRKVSNKKRGGQSGSKPKRRELFSSEKVDEVVSCPVPKECKCGGEVALATTPPRIHQVVEIPKIIPVTVTEYHIHKGRCNKCQKRYFGKLPDCVPRGVCGSNLSGLLSLLSTKYRLSKRLVQDFVSNVFGIKLSVGTISHNEALVSEALKPMYQELESKAKTTALTRYVDETGFNLLCAL